VDGGFADALADAQFYQDAPKKLASEFRIAARKRTSFRYQPDGHFPMGGGFVLEVGMALTSFTR
jgi:hypothetical protein